MADQRPSKKSQKDVHQAPIGVAETKGVLESAAENVNYYFSSQACPTESPGGLTIIATDPPSLELASTGSLRKKDAAWLM